MTLEARTSFGWLVAISAVVPSLRRTVCVDTGLRSTWARATAQSYRSLNAANSRAHLAPPIRLGLSGDRRRHVS